MAKVESLGIKRVDSVHYYVRDLERSQRFYVDYMDFEELGQSSPELEAEGKQRSMVFRAGDCVV
ncbi:MAG: VOC family protein, partial [Polyangiaceae bacterium]